MEALKSKRITKPVVAWVSGTCATLFKSEVQFGHAGAKSGGALESAQVRFCLSLICKNARKVSSATIADQGDHNCAFLTPEVLTSYVVWHPLSSLQVFVVSNLFGAPPWLLTLCNVLDCVGLC